MKPSIVVLTAVSILVVAASSSSRLFAAGTASRAVVKQRSGFLLLPPAAPAGQQVLYGHIKSVSPKGGHFELRFDPAFFLSGVTASRAKLEDTGSGDVPNDNYVRDESHRLLTYLISPTARVTVLTNEGTKGISATVIPVSELAQIVKGKNPKHRKLFEPLASGVWIRVRIDTVRELDQQYKP
jgi:hypothetical protein